MDFTVDLSNGVLTVSIFGDVDAQSARSVREYLDKSIEKYPFHTLVLDFKRVEFMDSTGIGVLLGRYKKIRSSGRELGVKGLNSQIDKVFRVSGLYQIIKAV